jgi:hypothetical protein
MRKMLTLLLDIGSTTMITCTRHASALRRLYYVLTLFSSRDGMDSLPCVSDRYTHFMSPQPC